jgi:hypothetical protein
MDAAQNFATMQDFIVGRLSDDERRAFEDQLVNDPALVHELEQTLRMRAGLQQLRSQGYFQQTTARRPMLRTWGPMLAAAALAGLALLLWVPHVQGPSPLLRATLNARATADTALAAHFTFVSVRGGAGPELELPPAGLIEIRAAPDTRETSARFRIALLRQTDGGSAQPVATLENLSLGADGYVHCYADAARLSTGSYLLRLQATTNSSSAAQLFSFSFGARGSQSAR